MKTGCCQTKHCPPRNRKNRIRFAVERIKSSATVGGDGHVDKSLAANWETFVTRSGTFKTAKGSETDREDQLTGLRPSVIEIPYDKLAGQITSEMRVRLPYQDTTRTLQIESVVDVDYAGEVLQISVTENTGG